MRERLVHCDKQLPATDLHGNSIMIPRFACNLVLRKRRSAAEVIRGIRSAAGLFLTFSGTGRLQLSPEADFAGEARQNLRQVREILPKVR